MEQNSNELNGQTTKIEDTTEKSTSNFKSKHQVKKNEIDEMMLSYKTEFIKDLCDHYECGEIRDSLSVYQNQGKHKKDQSEDLRRIAFNQFMCCCFFSLFFVDHHRRRYCYAIAHGYIFAIFGY